MDGADHMARPSPRWRIAGGTWLLAGGVAALLVAFVVFPAIDLRTTAIFYVPGQGFPWRTYALGEFVRHDLPPFVLACVLVSVVVGVIGLLRRNVQWGLTGRKIVYLLASLLVGPGLLVESLLKTHYGRARPEDLTLFGGTETYTAPLWPADACASNCSFVSGHAALAFWVTAYAFVVPPRWRSRVLTAGVLFGCAVGAMRVMQGAHFASDIAYGAVVVVAVNFILARLILRPEPQGSHGDTGTA